MKKHIFLQKYIFLSIAIWRTLKHLLPENPVGSIIEDLNCYFHKLLKKVNITIYYMKLKIILVWISISFLKDMWYEISLGLIILFVSNANHKPRHHTMHGPVFTHRGELCRPASPQCGISQCTSHRRCCWLRSSVMSLQWISRSRTKDPLASCEALAGCLLETFKGTNLILYPIVWQKTKFSKMTHEANATVWVAYTKRMLYAYLNKLKTLNLALMFNDSGSREGLSRNIIQILITYVTRRKLPYVSIREYKCSQGTLWISHVY